MDEPKKVTMKDIADKLGISVMSVSRALSGKGGIDKKKQRLILKTAFEMGFEFSERKHHSIDDLKFFAIYFNHNVQFILDDPNFKGIFTAILNSLSRNKIGFIYLSEEENQLAIPEIINTKKVDGVILIEPFNKNFVTSLEELNIPYVIIGCSLPEFQTIRITSNDMGGMRKITSYLLKQGLKKIYFLSYHATFKFLNFIYIKKDFLDERLLGYKIALMENNISLNENLIKIKEFEYRETEEWRGDTIVNLGYEMMKEIYENELKKRKEPIGVICVEDLMAIGAKKLILEKGLKFKKDIYLAGYDGIDWAVKSDIPITTLQTNKKLMGEVAVDMLLKKIKNKDAVEKIQKDAVEKIQIEGNLFIGATA